MAPSRTGLYWFNAVAEACRAEAASAPVATLAPAWLEALPQVLSLLRVRFPALTVDDHVHAAWQVSSRLQALWDAWDGATPFGSVCMDTAEAACAATGITGGPRDTAPEAWAAAADQLVADAWRDMPDPDRRVLAVRRFVWWVFGAPENARRVLGVRQHGRMAPSLFAAVIAWLEARDYAYLATWYQVREGAWGWPDGDHAWWRSRASEGRRRVKQALAGATGRARLRRLYDDLER